MMYSLCHTLNAGLWDGREKSRPSNGLGQFDIVGAFATITTSAQLVRDFLVVGQTGEARTLDSRDVYEDVFAAIFGCDKAVAFGGVEPFYGACGHIRCLLFGAAHGVAAAWRRSLDRVTERRRRRQWVEIEKRKPLGYGIGQAVWQGRIVRFVQGVEGQSSDLYKNPPMVLVISLRTFDKTRLFIWRVGVAFRIR